MFGIVFVRCSGAGDRIILPRPSTTKISTSAIHILYNCNTNITFNGNTFCLNLFAFSDNNHPNANTWAHPWNCIQAKLQRLSERTAYSASRKSPGLSEMLVDKSRCFLACSDLPANLAYVNVGRTVHFGRYVFTLAAPST